jgi:DNA-binding NarL/FixJ family response regulator
MPAPPTNVFALLTQPIVAEGLIRVLSQCPDLKFVGHSADPRSALDEMLRAKADLILLDHAFGLRVIYDLLSALKRAIPPA